MRKSKEEDRIEKLIRGLLKLPENRRCINCNSLGPQYVCTTFWTFVCTNCSGVHREFTHRVKSVSMAKFTSDEVNALQAGGNERAREIYFKTWDRQRNFFPDNSNIHRLRDFIKHVYIDRRFTGDSHLSSVSSSKKSDKDEPCESTSGSRGEKSCFQERPLDRYGRYSYKEVRSPGYLRDNSRKGSSRFEGTDSRYSYQVDESRIIGRSTTQMFTTEDIKAKRRSPDRHECRDKYNLPPVRPVREIFGENFLALRVGDRSKSSDRSDNVAPNGQLSNVQQIGDHPKAVNRSVDGQEGPVQQSGGHSRTNHKRSISAFAGNAQTGGQMSDSNATMKPKSGSAGSLIDFATFPSPDTSNQKEEQNLHTSRDSEKLDSADPPTKETTCNAPPKNTLEFFLFELAIPVETAPRDGLPSVDDTPSCAPSNNCLTLPQSPVTMPSQVPVQLESPTLEIVPTLPSNSGDSSGDVLALTLPDIHAPSAVSTITSNGALSDSNSGIKSVGSSDVGANPQMVSDLFGGHVSAVEEDKKQTPNIQQPEHSDAINSDSISSALQTCPLDQVANNQPATLSLVPSAEVAFGNSTAQKPYVDQGSTQEMKSAERIHLPSAEASSGGRKELPADLFTSFYPPGPSGPFQGWQMGSSCNMGFNMQHLPASVHIPAIQEMGKSRNPFDINDNSAQHHTTTFPSLSPLQVGLPNVSASLGMPNVLAPLRMPNASASLGMPNGSAPLGMPNASAPLGMMRSLSFGSLVPAFPPTQTPSYSSGVFMGEHLCDNNMPSSRQQGIGSFGSEGEIPGSISSTPNPYGYSAPTNPSSFPAGRGNPFG